MCSRMVVHGTPFGQGIKEVLVRWLQCEEESGDWEVLCEKGIVYNERSKRWIMINK